MLITDFLDDVFYYGLLLCLNGYTISCRRESNLRDEIREQYVCNTISKQSFIDFANISSRTSTSWSSSAISSTGLSGSHFPTPVMQQLQLLLDIGYIKEFYYFENAALCTRYTVSKFGLEFLICNVDITLGVYFDYGLGDTGRLYNTIDVGETWTESRSSGTGDKLVHELLGYLATEELPRFLVHDNPVVRNAVANIIDERTIYENLAKD